MVDTLSRLLFLGVRVELGMVPTAVQLCTVSTVQRTIINMKCLIEGEQRE